MACAAKLTKNITRFAPSPTGPLHLGHAYAALVAHARASHGGFLLRIEDIDQSRARPQYETAIYDDLRWLGLDWSGLIRQSDRMPHYRQALSKLAVLGLIYPCRCRRRDIREALGAPQEGAPLHGPDGLIYPGLCRGRSLDEAGPEDALRLDAARALSLVGPLTFTETGEDEGEKRLSPPAFIEQIGDVVLARKEMGTSYHLSVVVDDAAQGISEVTRGKDLYESTWIHVLLQKLLKLPTPRYHHHALIRDEAGRRLAKRDDARAISLYRAEGATPQDIRKMVGFRL